MIVTSCCHCNISETKAVELKHCRPGLGQGENLPAIASRSGEAGGSADIGENMRPNLFKSIYK